MKFHQTKSNIKTIKTGDPGWLLKDGLVLSPRAGFQINQKCPKEYKMIIRDCINNGWLEPVAYMFDHELTFDTLKDVVL